MAARPDDPPAGRLTLVEPDALRLPGYLDALHRGWSPDNLRPQAAQDHIKAINTDAPAFLAGLTQRAPAAASVTLPDGSSVPRLPGFTLWLWDGDFAGCISLRWQPGTSALPPHVLGHIGYAVVPWKRGHGYAARALAQFLPRARAEGLAQVELTCSPANIASIRTIEACGGQFIESFTKPSAHGGGESRRYRIPLI